MQQSHSHILQRPENQSQVYTIRHGIAANKNQHERTVKRRGASFADAIRSMDGFTIQLRYIDHDGRIKSDLYCIGVLDVYADALIGYAIGKSETAELVISALRSATARAGYRPYQLQYDNSSANKSAVAKQVMQTIAKVDFSTTAYNGKSKPIENWIGRLEGHNLHHFPNFKGGNITSPDLSIKANPDFLAQQSKESNLPTRAQCIEQFVTAIAVHNNTAGSDGKTPLQ